MQQQLLAEVQGASRQLCKRQLIWFRGDPMFDWLDAERPADVIADEIAAALAAPPRTGALLCTCADAIHPAAVAELAVVVASAET